MTQMLKMPITVRVQIRAAREAADHATNLKEARRYRMVAASLEKALRKIERQQAGGGLCCAIQRLIGASANAALARLQKSQGMAARRRIDTCVPATHQAIGSQLSILPGRENLTARFAFSVARCPERGIRFRNLVGLQRFGYRWQLQLRCI